MDTLEVFGVEYTNVTGIKATDDNGDIKTYIRPQGTKTISANIQAQEPHMQLQCRLLLRTQRQCAYL